MEKLPEELLCRTFRSIERIGDLQKLPLVNRKWARIATPLLYERVSLDEGPYKQQVRALRQLLSTLVSSPTSRSLVRRLDMGHWKNDEANACNLEIPSMSLADLAGIIQCLPALASCPIELQRKFGVNLLSLSSDAMLTAVINLLPNLTSLSLTVNRCQPLSEKNGGVVFLTHRLEFGETLTMRLIALSATQPLASFPVLSCLSWVQISEDVFFNNGSEATQRWEVNIIALFLRLPTLRTFFGRGCSDMNSRTRWACDERASSVTNIELYASRLGSESIRKILSSCQALGTLVCERICRECFGEEVNVKDDSSYIGLHHDLYDHRESLTHLRLIAKSCLHANSREDKPVETLVGLNKLTTLAIDESALLDLHADVGALRSLDNFFPSNLQTIDIIGEPEECQDAMFLEIGRRLLSDANLPAVDFHQEFIGLEAANALKVLPGITIKMIGVPDSDRKCKFRMDRIKMEESPAESVNEGRGIGL